MKDKTATKQQGRLRRHARIRARVIGTAERPRVCVYKSNRYLHAQLVDDSTEKTLVAGSTKEAGKEKKMNAAVWLGEELAKRAKEAGITKAVFDRGGFRYTGRIAAMAEALRKGGLEM